MKISILGNTTNPITKQPNDPYSWFVLTHKQGFELNGHQVQLIDYRSNRINSIRNQLVRYKPHYVFTHLTFHNDVHKTSNILQLFSDLYKKHNIKFIHTCNDARTEDRYMKDLSHSFYAAFVGTYDMMNNCQPKWNMPVYYMPYSSLTYNNIAEPVNELKINKPVFTGSPDTHNDRRVFIKLLKEYGSIKIFKTQSGQDLRHRTPELSSSAICILGLCTGYDLDGYIDPRPFQYMGTGACMIIRKFKDMDDIIPPDLYYPFDSYERKDAKYVKDLFRKISKTDTWPMRCKAFRFIQQNHSSKIRMKQIIDVLEERKETVL